MSARHRTLLHSGEVAIDVIVEGEGPAVVLLPSLGRDSEDYDAVAEGFAAAGQRVLRPQPRGLGASRGPMQGITLRDFADDVAVAITRLADGPAILVGHAFGNWVARMVATRHPALVRGVVIAAAAPRVYPSYLTANIRRIADPATPAPERLELLRQTFFAPGNDASAWLTGWHKDVRDAQFAAHRATEQNEWWGAADKPLLDLQAAQDPFRPPETRLELRDELGPRVAIALIDGASHALIPERPTEAVAAILAWARGLHP